MITGIYKIINNINGNIYVGSAINIKRRWSSHKSELKSGKHRNKYLQRAWNKYKETSFSFEIIEIVENKDLLIDLEQGYIDALKPKYNLNLNLKNPNKEFSKRIDKFKDGKNYYFRKDKNIFTIYFTIDGKSYSFGTYKNEVDVLQVIYYLKCFSRKELLEYWDKYHNPKKINKGYYFNKNKNKYQVQILIESKKQSFGYFTNEKDAAMLAKEILLIRNIIFK